MYKISIKGECTVDVKDGESLNQACFRSINEALNEVNEKFGYGISYLDEYYFYENIVQPAVDL